MRSCLQGLGGHLWGVWRGQEGQFRVRSSRSIHAWPPFCPGPRTESLEQNKTPLVVTVQLPGVKPISVLSPGLDQLGLQAAGEVSAKTSLFLHGLPELLGGTGESMSNRAWGGVRGGDDFCFRLTEGFIMPEGQYLPWLQIDEYYRSVQWLSLLTSAKQKICFLSAIVDAD